MKAKVLEQSTKYDVPIAFLRGRKQLYGQDFVTVDNLLANEPEFRASIAGVALVSPGSVPQLTIPGLQVTGEFRLDPTTGERIPLWYGSALLNTVSAKSSKPKAVNLNVDTSDGNTLVRLSGLTERENQYIADNTIEVRVDGQVQARRAFLVDHAEGSILIDLSTITIGQHSVSATYELAEMSAQVNIFNGVYDLRINKHFQDLYTVKVLLSARTTGTVTYQSGETTLQDAIVARDLYRKIAPELVEPDSETFGIGESLVLPSERSYQIFAIRSSRPDTSTSMFVLPPQGVSVEEPWFVRVGGTGTSKYKIQKGVLSVSDTILRKEVVIPRTRSKLSISARSVRISVGENNTIRGIDITPEGFPETSLPVESFNGSTGIVQLKGEVPPAGRLVAEYKEETDWFEYQGIQLNPALVQDQEEVINNYFLIYILPEDKVGANEEPIGHTTLPKVVEGEIKRYTYDELKNELASKVNNDALALALVSVEEPVDQDYYNSYDARSLGGYDIPLTTITSLSDWDGEDVDITGVLVSKVPQDVIEKIANDVELWENITDRQVALQRAEEFVLEKIERHKRLGMKMYVDKVET